MSIILALVIFSAIVIVHEFGHFLLAKLNGIMVIEFSVGMGPRIFSHVWGETRYSLKLLPFGGSCMMLGEDEEAPVPREDSKTETGEGREEQRNQADLAGRYFGSKSVWARISVVIAGPMFNFILAFLLSMIFVCNLGYDDTVISVASGLPAQEAGMQDGDEILKMGGSRTYVYREIRLYNQMYQGKTTEVTFRRDGQVHTVTLEPRKAENGRYYYGFQKQTGRTKGGPLQLLKYSAAECRYWIKATVESLKMMLRGKVGLDDVSGPVGIVSTIGDAYEANRGDGWYYVALSMVMMSILLSVNLGVMNLLPIPALDGGRLVFLFLEAIRGKAISQEKEGMVHFAGFVVLMGLMVLILFNDIKNIFM